MSPEDRRKAPRLTLAIEDGYFGSFQLPNAENLVAPILNLSAGGLNMLVSGQTRERIKEGDTLLLKTIVGGTRLAFLSDIDAHVRWIREEGGQVHAGCEFENLPEDVLLQLNKFVSTERMTRGQYD